MNTCEDCGKRIRKRFTPDKRCYGCQMRYYEAKERILWAFGQDDGPDPLEETPMCVMCGREWGTSLQEDGKFYCSQCWIIWLG